MESTPYGFCPLLKKSLDDPYPKLFFADAKLNFVENNFMCVYRNHFLQLSICGLLPLPVLMVPK